MINRKNKNNLIQPEEQMELTKTVMKDDEDITNIKIDEWEWKSYHKIDVKQNIGNGGIQHN